MSVIFVRCASSTAHVVALLGGERRTAAFCALVATMLSAAAVEFCALVGVSAILVVKMFVATRDGVYVKKTLAYAAAIFKHESAINGRFSLL